MKYTTKEAIQNFLLIQISPTFDTQIDTWIEVVSREIDNYTGRTFIADTEFSTREYTGNDRYELIIDDAVAVEDYTALPYNKIPKTAIKATTPFFRGTVYEISGKWGYSVAVPEDIAHAATIMTAGIINRGRKVGKIKQEKIGNYQVSYEDDKDGLDEAYVILDRYKKIWL